MTRDAAEEVMRAMERALDDTCAAHGLTDIEAAQFKFIALIYMLGTVAQRAGLAKAYAAERVGEMLPRAMDASEGDQHIDFHRGGVAS